MAVVKLVACGRDQTPFGMAVGYLCTRPRGHSGPCAMVYFEGPTPPVDRSAVWRALCVTAVVVVILVAFTLAVLLDGCGAMRGHP